MRVAIIVVLALAAGCAPRHRPAPLTTGAGPTIALSTNVIRVGDLVTANLFIPHATNERVELPDLQRDPEIVVSPMQRQLQADPPGTRLTLQLTSWAPSNHVVFTNFLRITTPDGSVRTQALPFATLQVQSVLAGSNATALISKEFHKWSDPRLAKALWITLGILLLAAGLAWYLIARRRKAPAATLPPVIPAHEKALRRLAELQARNYIVDGCVEPFYVELSGIVRCYIEDRFGLHAPEQTTDEFIREAASSRLLTYEQQLWVGAFLNQSDLVKFARYQPGAPEMAAAWDAADQLVRQTAQLLVALGSPR